MLCQVHRQTCPHVCLVKILFNIIAKYRYGFKIPFWDYPFVVGRVLGFSGGKGENKAKWGRAKGLM